MASLTPTFTGDLSTAITKRALSAYFSWEDRNYISQGKGLIIHIDTCKEFRKINVNKSKIINVRWKDFVKGKDEFVAKINVVIKNEIGSLGSLSSIIGKSMSNIRNLQITERNSDFFKIELEIDVIDLEHLSKVIVSLRTSDFIENVTRI